MSFQGREGGPLGPYYDAQAVTPSDTVDLPGGPCQALYVAGDGNVTVTLESGAEITIAMVAGWQNLAQLRVRRVHVGSEATETTATGILALYV